MRRCCAALLFCSMFCALAFPQNSGTIRCEADQKQVPAWIAPASAYVAEQLACGQLVSVIELKSGFYKIQVGNRVGYVDAKYVQLPQEQGKPTAREAQATAAGKAAQPPASDRENRQRYGIGLAFDVSHVKYEEPSLTMQESGMMWGVSGDYAERLKNFLFKLDARFSLGDVDYSSPSGEFGNLRDYQFETRYSFGYSLKNSATGHLTPFAGIGYRYLHDNLDSSGPGGYDRKTKYLYSPLGMEFLVRLKGGWSLGASGEYDLFWRGWQTSELGDVDPGLNTLENTQEDGWGARGSIRIIKDLGKMDFAVEPFFRYWDIDNSDYQFITYHGDPVSIGWEPANTSKEWGARIGIRF